VEIAAKSSYMDKAITPVIGKKFRGVPDRAALLPRAMLDIRLSAREHRRQQGIHLAPGKNNGQRKGRRCHRV